MGENCSFIRLEKSWDKSFIKFRTDVIVSPTEGYMKVVIKPQKPQMQRHIKLLKVKH